MRVFIWWFMFNICMLYLFVEILLRWRLFIRNDILRIFKVNWTKRVCNIRASRWRETRLLRRKSNCFWKSWRIIRCIVLVFDYIWHFNTLNDLITIIVILLVFFGNPFEKCMRVVIRCELLRTYLIIVCRKRLNNHMADILVVHHIAIVLTFRFLWFIKVCWTTFDWSYSSAGFLLWENTYRREVLLLLLLHILI